MVLFGLENVQSANYRDLCSACPLCPHSADTLRQVQPTSFSTSNELESLMSELRPACPKFSESACALGRQQDTPGVFVPFAELPQPLGR